ncbi:TonB-dependent receptor domain-containing protein [Sphingomonas bacterium]|uniref:TonB-dependent receptor domain-containing protein n=1 Tax=Sphingomonas bacterium TaxID=1895847 RepID=UPI0015755D2A|nr:TonB-dependent receptor [Sphingomonas bacterium]
MRFRDLGHRGLGTTTRAGAVALLVAGAPAWAQARTFDLAAMPLGQALRTVSQSSGKQIIFADDLVRGKTAPRLRGPYTADAAIGLLLASSGLVARTAPSGAVMVLRSQQEPGQQSVAGGTDPEPAVAQTNTTAQAAATETGGDVIVTANKSRQRLIDVPVSVTAETGAQLRRRGATQLQDLVETTPGLSNPGTGGGNTTNLVIRGITTDASVVLKQPTVSILFDDIPVDPATAGLLTTNLRIVDIERVEVLRGPQGTLFGSGSIAGAVRYITNKPDATRLSGSIEGSVAGTYRGANSEWGNAVLNVPIVTDRVAARAVGYGFNEGGWIANTRLNQSNVNRNKTYGGRIALTAKATDQLSVTLTGAYQNSRDYSPGDSLYVQPAGSGKQVTTERQAGDSRARSALANLGLTYDFGGVSLFSSSTYIRRKVDIIDDYGFYTDYLQLAFKLPALNDVSPGRQFGASDIYTQELRLGSNGTGPFRWTFGGFYLRSDTQGGQTITAPGLLPYLGTSNLANLSSPGRQEELAGFGEATYTIARKLDLTGGLRVSRNRLDISSTSSGLLLTMSGTNAVTFKLPERETSYNPRFSVQYRPTGQLSVYAQAARGYRIGGANLTAGLGGPGIPTDYRSDHLWNYEAGVKTNLLDGRLQINADGYYIDWKNLQVSLLSNNIEYTGNAGAARVYGFELEAAAKPVTWLDLGGSLSLNNAALTRDAPTLVRTSAIGGSVVGAKDGDRLPASPRAQGSAYAQLNFTYKDDAAFIRASGQYVGASYTDFASQGLRFGEYGTFDVRAGIVHHGVEVTIFGRNLLDSDGKRSAAPAFLVGGVFPAAPQYAFRIRPRTIGLTGRVAF